jgi:hypothetical protein
MLQLFSLGFALKRGNTKQIWIMALHDGVLGMDRSAK